MNEPYLHCKACNKERTMKEQLKDDKLCYLCLRVAIDAAYDDDWLFYYVENRLNNGRS